METSRQRTILKSAPELWSELSDGEALARRLEGFAPLRITAIEEGSRIQWEGGGYEGSIALEGAGWGTKVTVCARPSEADQLPAPAPPAAEEPEWPALRRRPLHARLLGLLRTPPLRRGAVSAWEQERLEALEQALFAPAKTHRSEGQPPEPASEERVGELLERFLDGLGSAQRRPFSRA